MREGDFTFDPRAYGPAVAELLTPPRECDLGPSPPNRGVHGKLKAFTIDALGNSRKIADSAMARGCIAGLWLYHDFFDESHAVSQEIHTPTGSYWHGILHRREPDYNNAKYWFRRVGRHAIFEPLRQAAAALAAATDLDAEAKFLVTPAAWDPLRFIDLCEAASQGSVARISNLSEPMSLASLCRQIQTREWELLFDHCYRAATA